MGIKGSFAFLTGEKTAKSVNDFLVNAVAAAPRKFGAPIWVTAVTVDGKPAVEIAAQYVNNSTWAELKNMGLEFHDVYDYIFRTTSPAEKEKDDYAVHLECAKRMVVVEKFPDILD